MSSKEKLFLITKEKFKVAYSKASMNMEDFNDMLYYMNILYLIKPYSYKVNARQLYIDIMQNKY